MPHQLFPRRIEFLNNNLFQVFIGDIADDPSPIDEKGWCIVKVEREGEIYVPLYYLVVLPLVK